jgi:hypothetical protein
MEVCPIRVGKTCYYCKKPGHFKRDYIKRLREKNSSVKGIEVEADKKETNNKLFNDYFVLSGVDMEIRDRELKISILINGMTLDAIIVDTGAMVNVIKSRHVKGKIERTNIRLRAANRTEIKILGITRIEFEMVE